MPSLRNAVRHTLNLSSLHQRWWWNDPDCLLVRDTDTHLTETEVQSAVTLVGLSGGLLVSSDDLRKVNPDRLRWISLLTPNLGLRGLPLDILESEVPEVYLVKLRGNGQDWLLVGVFNWNDRPTGCRLNFIRLGFRSGVALDVFDFWWGSYTLCSENEMIFVMFHPTDVSF
jgi:alpha-galactosidase